MNTVSRLSRICAALAAFSLAVACAAALLHTGRTAAAAASAAPPAVSIVHYSFQPGTLTVAMDLGSVLLLRFAPEQAARPSQWMALRRGAHAPQWHALRCAVYSPRPAAAPGAAATDGVAADTHDRS